MHGSRRKTKRGEIVGWVLLGDAIFYGRKKAEDAG